MSPKQQRERRNEIEEAAVKRIIEKEWTIFRHDEAKRATTRVELVSALRKLKTRLSIQIKAAKHLQWLEYTNAFIDEKIEILTGDQPLKVRKEALTPEKPVGPLPKATLFLSKLFKKRGIKPSRN